MSMVEKFSYSIKEDGDLKYVDGKFSDGNDIDLGVVEIHGWTTATEDQVVEALRMADELWMDKDLGSYGRRNDDAVNLCIALHVLGIEDMEAWFNEAYDKHAGSSNNNWYEFMEHVNRVSRYLCAWGPDNDMGRALEKQIL